ncbi:MAG: hypothetical protein VST67_00440, partial [Nitrospirota bacterium]|nr:hypothetical protein [Nitrospirota bacterium]
EEAYHKIRQLHRAVYCDNQESLAQAYDLPPIAFTGKRMREWVKSWVTEWDVKRLLSRDHVEIEIRSVKREYQEDTTLEASPEEETDQPSVVDSTLPNTSEASVNPSTTAVKRNPFASYLSASSEENT